MDNGPKLVAGLLNIDEFGSLTMPGNTVT